jgi:hypothetical protein
MRQRPEDHSPTAGIAFGSDREAAFLRHNVAGSNGGIVFDRNPDQADFVPCIAGATWHHLAPESERIDQVE